MLVLNNHRIRNGSKMSTRPSQTLNVDRWTNINVGTNGVE